MEENNSGNSIFRFEQKAGINSVMGNWGSRAKAAESGTEQLFTDRKIFIYKLVDWTILNNNLKALRSVFYTALGITGNFSVLSFSVLANSGWVSFSNQALLQSARYSGRKYTPEDLDQIVQTFFSRLKNAHTIYAQRNPGFTVPYFFDCKIVLKEVIPSVLSNDIVSKWIVRYGVSLVFTDDSRTNEIPVRDSLLEFIIDSFGFINSFLLRWRPVEQKIVTSLLPPPENDHVDGHSEHEGQLTDQRFYDYICATYAEAAPDHHDEEEEGPTQISLEYYLAGGNTYQSHILPQLFIQNGHHAQKVGVVKDALNIRFSITSSEQEVRIGAITDAGPDANLQYDWLVWDVTAHENYFESGNRDYCTVLAGVFQVLVTVTDASTGFIEQHQELVYATEPNERQFEVERKDQWGCTDTKAINYDPNANCDDGSCKYENNAL